VRVADVEARAADWPTLRAELDTRGHARIPGLVSRDECRELIALYDDDSRFRKTVSLDRHRFGSGEYRYLDRPLPSKVDALRRDFYANLVAVANAWQERLGFEERFERSLASYLRRCHAAGQARPTPLLLRYGVGGFNCLHQDLYGELAFPIQVTVMLSRPRDDFEGGEFLLVEQRPRQQSRGEAFVLEQGEAIVFANRHRPVEGVRGFYRAQVRHGVSRIRSGLRFTLGIIFHDAK
jgi:hypothetical protein